MSNIRSPYWRAAFWAAAVIGPPYVISALVELNGSSYHLEGHAIIRSIAEIYWAIALMPGVVLEVIRAIIFSPSGGHGMNDKSPLIPLGSWLVWFVVLIPLFNLLQRYGNKPASRTANRSD